MLPQNVKRFAFDNYVTAHRFVKTQLKPAFFLLMTFFVVTIRNNFFISFCGKLIYLKMRGVLYPFIK